MSSSIALREWFSSFRKERNGNIRASAIWAAVLWLFVAARISRRGAKIPNVAGTEKADGQTEPPSFLTFSQISVHEVDVPLREFYGYDGTLMHVRKQM